MGMMTGVMLAVSAGAAIYSGYQEGAEADRNAEAVLSESNYNAGIYEQQAGMIEQQKNLKIAQDKRQIRFVQGETVAMTAHKGIELSGSPLAILVDSSTQMNMDMAINAYNYDMDKYAALSQADSIRRKGATTAGAYRRSGDTARMGGIVGGLTTMFSSGTSAASSFKQTTPTKKINTTGKGGYGSRQSAYRSLGI